MASVTFTANTGGDGSTVTDDNDAGTGLGNGGHRTRFVPMFLQTVNTCAHAVSKAAEALASSVLSAASAATSAAHATASETHRNAAQVSASESAQSAVDAEGFASLAQATNPDAPMRLNTNKITNNFTILAGYNAVSGGDIEITNNVTVTINQFSTWSIV